MLCGAVMCCAVMCCALRCAAVGCGAVCVGSAERGGGRRAPRRPAAAMVHTPLTDAVRLTDTALAAAAPFHSPPSPASRRRRRGQPCGAPPPRRARRGEAKRGARAAVAESSLSFLLSQFWASLFVRAARSHTFACAVFRPIAALSQLRKPYRNATFSVPLYFLVVTAVLVLFVGALSLFVLDGRPSASVGLCFQSPLPCLALPSQPQPQSQSESEPVLSSLSLSLSR